MKSNEKNRLKFTAVSGEARGGEKVEAKCDILQS